MSFPRYPNYKDSGVEWLGEVPAHWDVISIKWLSAVRRGASPRPIDDAKYFDDEGEFAWVRIADVSACDGILNETTQRLSELGSSLSVKIAPGELFVSIAGTVGKPCVSAIKACIHDGFVYFPTLEIHPAFLYRIFESGTCYGGLGKWGTQLNLNTDTIGSIRVALPPAEELAGVLAFLDRETAKIDELVVKQRRLMELLKEKRQAVISHAVTKGLNPDATMKPSGIEWLGEVPAHWEVRKLKYLCDVQTGDKDTENAVDDGLYPFFVRSQTVERINSMAFDCEAILTAGDGVGVGKVFHYHNGPFDFHQRVYMMNNFHEVSGSYLFHFFRENFYKVALEGGAKSTVDSLRRPVFLNFTVCLPPKEEQSAIVATVDQKSTEFDTLTAEAQRAIDLLQERRTALISAAVTGQIDVRALSPTQAMEATT
jgi:type I restriction enzyme S subunit